MTQVRNEDDSANDLQLTDQAAFASDSLLDELLESEPVTQAEYFLEACSSEEGRITDSASVVIGNGCESADSNEESIRNNDETKQHKQRIFNDDETKRQKQKISNVSEKTEAIPRIVNKGKEEKMKGNSDDSGENKEEMEVSGGEKNGNSENNNNTVGEDSDNAVGEDGDSAVGENNDNEKEDDKDEESEGEYVVEKILNKRYNRRKKRVEYLIKWAGYDSESENTWESAENCKSAPDAVREYEESLKKNEKRYLLRSRSVIKGSGSNDDEDKPSQALKKETDKINEEPYSEESSDDDSDEIQPKRAKVDCVLGVKKEDDEILAVVRFEDGHYDLLPTRVLVSKCPKKLVNYYERSLKFVSS